jgi:uncharacterized protein YndB with AHSA1/START domain
MERIVVEVTVNAPVQTVWECWTDPKEIQNWNFASDEWCCPSAMNDLRTDGSFSWRMEAKDGSMGFDYAGSYTEIKEMELIEKVLDDNRKVTIQFSESDGFTTVNESFEPDENDPELQKQGWQAILNNFKKHVESKENEQ